MNTIHVDVVSAEESIWSGKARFVALPGKSGELGIYPRHTPLITRIKPGAVRIERADNGEEEFVFVAGGILEVQPGTVATFPDGFQAIVTNGGVYFEGHVIKVIGYDAAGNKAESDEVRVYVRHKKK